MADDLNTVEGLARSVRAKYPKAYDSMTDTELVGRVTSKFPQYRTKELIGDLGAKAQAAQAKQRPVQTVSEEFAAVGRGQRQAAQDVLSKAAIKGGGKIPLGAHVKSLAHEATGVVAGIESGLTDPKNAAIMAAGLFDPAIPMAYFGASATEELPGAIHRTIKNLSPDNLQEALLTGSQLAASASGAGRTNSPIADTIVKQAVKELRQAGEKVDNTLLRTAKGGMEMSKEGLVSSRLRNTEGVIRQRINVLRPKVEQRINTLEKSGAKIDVQQPVADLFIKEFRKKAAGNNIEDMAELAKRYNRAAFRSDPAGPTGPGGTFRLHNLSPKELHSIVQDLGDVIYEKGGSEFSKNVSKRLRYQLSEGLTKVDPEVGRMMRTEHGLLNAEEAARSQYEAYQQGLTGKVKHWLYGQKISTVVAGLGALYISKAMGIPWETALVPMLVTKVLFDATPSATIRASLYQRLADKLEGQSTKIGAGRGPSLPPTVTPPAPGGAPPAGPAVPGSGGAPAGAAPVPTAGGAAASSPSGTGLTAGTPSGPPAGAASLTSGASEAITKTQFGQATNAAERVDLTGVSDKVHAVYLAIKREFPELSDKGAMKMAAQRVEKITGEPAKMKTAKQRSELDKKHGLTPTAEQSAADILANVEQARLLQAAVKPEVTKVKRTIDGIEREVSVAPEGASGVSEATRRTGEAIDKASEAQRSALATASAKRSAQNIIDLTRVDLLPEQRRALERKIADAERKRASRAQSAAEKPAEQTAVSSGSKIGALSGDAPVDQLLIATESLYAEIKKMPSGTEYIKGLKDHAKELKMSPALSYQEALEAYEALAQLGKRVSEKSE